MLLFSRKSCSNKKYLSQKAQDACDKFAKSLKKENIDLKKYKENIDLEKYIEILQKEIDQTKETSRL